MEVTGVGRYALEVARGLPGARPGWRFVAHCNRPDLLADAGLELRRTRWPTASSAGRVAWVHAGSAAGARRDRPDLWFGTAYALPLWWRGPAVVAIHDLVPLLARDRYRGAVNSRYASWVTRRSAGRASTVLCGSRETEARLVAALGVSAEKVAVIPYGVSPVFTTGPEPRPGPGEEPVLLFVGTFEPRKGLAALHDALGRLDDLGARLVVAGRPGWGTEELMGRLHADPRVQVVEAPTDAELARLYRSATALVHPSTMEGFGLPVAEALASGTPVVATDLACVREFAGDVPVYVPPGDGPALVAAIRGLLEAPDEREPPRRRWPGAGGGPRLDRHRGTHRRRVRPCAVWLNRAHEGGRPASPDHRRGRLHRVTSRRRPGRAW